MDDGGILQLAAASNDISAARSLARSLGGIAYCDEREVWRQLPFRALVTVTTDDMEAVARVGDVGTYVIFRRLIKPGVPKVVALFPLIRATGLSHAAADAYWRDVHAPLALEHHAYMSHYAQLSVVATLSGRDYDGFALCGFDSADDARNRFFTRPGSVDVIAADVRRFANVEYSPRRLLATVYE